MGRLSREAELFLALQDGEVVGTICAGEDRAANARRGRRECIFGFFECYPDSSIAGALLERVQGWARKRELDTLFGPFNLDYEDSYGILIEGRDRPPAILCGHTPPYYRDLIEGYGFEKARGDNLAFAIPIAEEGPERRRLARSTARWSTCRIISVGSVNRCGLRWPHSVDSPILSWFCSQRSRAGPWAGSRVCRI